jgi:hypothetical protein
MAKLYGVEYPERALMAVISDLLGIEHFTTSRGATVRSDFLRRVLQALGRDADGLSKDELIAACVATSTRRPFDPRLLSPGATVTNQVLQVIVDGIIVNGLGRAVSHPESAEPVAASVSRDFIPEDFDDERDRQLAERAVRHGQDRFRTDVLETYGSACAITGANAATALEAAHVTPYKGPQTNVLQNAICLRADLHRLWDGGQLALDEQTAAVLVSAALGATSYGSLEGCVAALPRRRDHRPSDAALRAHREWCGLPNPSH